MDSFWDSLKPSGNSSIGLFGWLPKRQERSLIGMEFVILIEAVSYANNYEKIDKHVGKSMENTRFYFSKREDIGLIHVEMSL